MNNKGFTLIELLGVIIILSLLILLVLPKITGSVKKYGIQTDELMLSMVVDAAKLYVEDNSDLYLKENGYGYCIELKELVDKEYLKLPIKQNNIDVTRDKRVKVTYEDGFIYEVVDKDECVEYSPICTIASDSIKKGTEIGAKYSCKVDPNKEKHSFYLLSYNDKDGNITKDRSKAKSVNLILERNICEDGSFADENNTCTVAWMSEIDYGAVSEYEYEYGPLNDKGPVTAMDYLYNATKGWTNVPNIQINYIDEGNCYGAIKTENNITKITKKDGTSVIVLKDKSGYNDLKARLPYESEVDDYDISPYLYGYLDGSQNSILEIFGYWIFSSDAESSSGAMYVECCSVADELTVEVSDINGIRPVINIPM